MVRESVTVLDVCTLLNEMLILDYGCVEKLVSSRVACNESIASHRSMKLKQTYSKG